MTCGFCGKIDRDYIRGVIISLANKHQTPEQKGLDEEQTELYLNKIEHEEYILAQLLSGITDNQIKEVFK